jgi:hypothetical protein
MLTVKLREQEHPLLIILCDFLPDALRVLLLGSCYLLGGQTIRDPAQCHVSNSWSSYYYRLMLIS